MSSQPEPEVVLYDVACVKGVCFSPVVWKIRMILNYKQIPYKTVFLDFQDIEPTLKTLGIPPYDPSNSNNAYTVPAIHVPSRGVLLMNSTPIAQYLESVYPLPALLLTSPLGTTIESKARTKLGILSRVSIMPREIQILSPKAQAYFRRTREAQIGDCTLEKLLEGEVEVWGNAKDALTEVSSLLLTNKDQGPFLLGGQVSYADFFIAASLQSARVVDEELWKRYFEYPGFRHIYEACVQFMEKKD